MAGIDWRNVAGMQDQTQGFANAGALFQRASEQMQGVLQEQIDQETTENTLKAVQQLRGASDVNQLNEIMAGLSGRLDHEAIGTAFNNSRNYTTGRTDAAQQQENWQKTFGEGQRMNTADIANMKAQRTYDENVLQFDRKRFDYGVKQDEEALVHEQEATLRDEMLRQNTLQLNDLKTGLNTNIQETRKFMTTPQSLLDENNNQIDVGGAQLKFKNIPFNPSEYYDFGTGKIDREGIKAAFSNEAHALKVISAIERNLKADKEMVAASEQAFLAQRKNLATVDVGGVTKTSTAQGLEAVPTTFKGTSQDTVFGREMSARQKAKVEAQNKLFEEIAGREAKRSSVVDDPVAALTRYAENVKATFPNDSANAGNFISQTGSLLQNLDREFGVKVTEGDLVDLIAGAQDDGGYFFFDANSGNLFKTLAEKVATSEFTGVSKGTRNTIIERLTNSADGWGTDTIKGIAGNGDDFMNELRQIKFEISGTGGLIDKQQRAKDASKRRIDNLNNDIGNLELDFYRN